MKTFLVIFTCAENSKAHQAWQQLDHKTQEDRYKKGLVANEEWVRKYQDQVIYDGGTLGETTIKVDTEGLQKVPSQMGHFLVVQANSHEEAANMFLDHPHFTYFPGDGVEILERQEAPRG